MPRVRTVVAAVIVALVVGLVHAFEFPSDAEFIVTDAEGTIVAIGRTESGRSADVEVWSGFEGPAQLTLFRSDGSTHAIDVVIADGVLTIDGIDLRVLLAEVFEHVSVAFVAEPGAGPNPPGLGPDEAGEGEARGQERRPEEPPGQERRPEEPPGQDRAPDEPPGQDRAPDEPPGQDRRPDEAPSPRR